MNKVLSERGSLIIYLDKVGNHTNLSPYPPFSPLPWCLFMFFTFVCVCISIPRFLTHDQRKLLLGSNRKCRWASYNPQPYLSMNTMNVSFINILPLLPSGVPISTQTCKLLSAKQLYFSDYIVPSLKFGCLSGVPDKKRQFRTPNFVATVWG